MSCRASGWVAATIIVVTPDVLPDLEPIGDPLLGADEAHVVDEVVGDQGGGLGLVAAEVQVLDLGGHVLVAVPAGEVVVEVLALRAHAADVQRDHRLHHVAQGRDVVADARP